MAPPNVKIKHITRSPSSSTGDTRFPKLDECAHFHYENVELGPIKVLLCDRPSDPCKSAICSVNKENEGDHLCFLVTVVSNHKKWVVRRSYQNFVFLDTQLHRCVYDRKYSLLRELNRETQDTQEKIRNLLSEYLERFSQLAGSLINCGPVLNWFELDNRGNRLIVTDEAAINTPAVAAAYVVVPYSAQATDEISFEVGDMISVIDMPPPEESSWWRGKRGFEVGFFPSECVEVIGDKVPNSFKLTSSSTKPVFRRHGKLIAFFRSFLLSRPSRRKLKQSGILKERVFGCDLGEHLLNTCREIPMVLKCCSEFIEEYGIVDGIYRLSGVSSNIQRLRLAFDEDRPLNLGDPATVHDIHSVASLLKMYFRELPNPLLTYQLYDKFVSAVQCVEEEVRLMRVRDVVQQLPPPHFRTLQYLLSHLARVAAHGEETGMTPKNIAIVWAPNLLRSRDVENGGVGALHVVGVQAVLTEYLIRFSDLIFDEKVPFEQEGLLRARPKSLAISTPTKLLSLEEARARALSTHLPTSQQKYIEVGGGPDKLPPKYHTVIDLPGGKQGSLPKLKKSPSGWKSFFSRGWYSGSTRDKGRFRSSARKASTGSLPHHSAYMPTDKPSTQPDESYGHRKKLRTVKSAESLAHCLKESPQHSNKDEFSGTKSSPQVSVDSASFEMSSPLSKSPGLQKHTRSSSHESYFESNEVISDPSFEEDEHGLFYYVSEQMRRMQQWSPEKGPEDATSTRSLDTRNDVFEMDAESSNRKQKLSPSDECARTKFQRLDENDCESLPTDPSALHCPSNDAFGILPPHVNDIWEDYELDPFLLYDTVVNKSTENEKTVVENVKRRSPPSDVVNDRTAMEPCVAISLDSKNDGTVSSWYESAKRRSPVLSSSEGENDRTVMEPYENAMLSSYDGKNGRAVGGRFEPVKRRSPLLSSSDGDSDGIMGGRYPVANKRRSPLLSSSDAEDTNDRTVVERYGNAETVLVEVHATQDSSSEEEQCSPKSNAVFFSETNEELDLSPVEVQDCRLDFSDEEFEATAVDEVFFEESKPEIEVEEDKILDAPLDSNLCSNDEVLDVKIPDAESVQYAEVLEPVPVLTPDNIESKDEKTPKKPSDLKLDLSPDTFDSNLSITTPPSPIYPPKSLKLHDFQSLRTKMDQLPPHKKTQIVMPSSPVEEVRKRFEQQSKQTNEFRSHKTTESPTEEIKQHSKKTPEFRSRTTVESPNEEIKFRPQKTVESPTEEIKFRSQKSVESPTEEIKVRSQKKVESPTEEIKFRSQKTVESPTEEIKFRPQKMPEEIKFRSSAKDLTPKLVRAFEVVEEVAPKTPVAKRHSEPPPNTMPTESVKRISNRFEKTSAEKSRPPKTSPQPSLFTQLKIRKLQSLQGSEATSPAPVDPWADPILDMQEDYHPMASYHPPSEDEDKVEVRRGDELDGKVEVVEEVSRVKEDAARMKEEEVEKVEAPLPSSHIQQPPTTTDQPTSEPENTPETDAVKRERINRIKEERRAQLRQKLNQESFRLEAEEKEKVQNKFRLRREGSKHSLLFEDDNAEDLDESSRSRRLSESGGNVSAERSRRLDESCGSESNKPKPRLRKDADKVVEDVKVLSESDKSRRLDAESKLKPSDDSNRSQEAVQKRVSSPGDFVLTQNKSNKKSLRSSYDESRKWIPPTDIRDKVAMFERSKDSDLCRLGPGGKFPQKQSPSALASSFVR